MGLSIPPKSRATASLHPEQWLILAVVLVVLAAGIDWGLPSRERIELLLHGIELTESQRERLTSARERFYEELDAREAAAAEDFLRGETQNLPALEAPGLWLTEEERFVYLRGFILGSAAIDERTVYSSLSRMNPPAGDFDPRQYAYGGAFIYPVGVLLWVADATGIIHATSDVAYYIDHPGDVARMYLIGRFLVVIAFVGVLLLLAAIGDLLGNRRAASLAMLVWATSTLPLNMAILTKPHVYAAFFSLLGTYLLVLWTRDPRHRYLAGSAVSMGIATGAAVSAAAMLLLYPFLTYRNPPGRRWIKLNLFCGLGALVPFLLTNPYALLSYDRYFLYVWHLGTDVGEGLGLAVPAAAKLPAYIGRMLTQSYAFPAGLAGAAYLLVAAIRSTGPVRRLALALVVLLIGIGLTLANPRMTVFLGPLICLFSGLGLDRLIAAVRTHFKATVIPVIAVAFIPPVFFFGLFAYDTINDDTWLEPTREWIAETGLGNIRPNTPSPSVGLVGVPAPYRVPPFPFLESKLFNLNALHEAAAAAGTLTSRRPRADRRPELPVARGDLPEFFVAGNYSDELQRFQASPLSPYYELDRELGARPSLRWLLELRTKSLSRVAAWVFVRKGRDGPDAIR
ncbi:MAG: hypothetical protein GF355_01750 [Candidatus Eisenbacteria bacterium]|nr:hypothetical protein [Candidatus Eisenbacteria bacterium]